MTLGAWVIPAILVALGAVAAAAASPDKWHGVGRPVAIPQTMPESSGQAIRQRYFDRWAPTANRVAEHLPVHAAVILAQGAVESGWGRHHMGECYNFHGIKADGEGVERAREIKEATRYSMRPYGTTHRMTLEEVMPGEHETIRAGFKCYVNPADSWYDHAFLVTQQNERWGGVAAYVDDPYAQVMEIWLSGYASSSDYWFDMAETIRLWYPLPPDPRYAPLARRAGAIETSLRLNLRPELRALYNSIRP